MDIYCNKIHELCFVLHWLRYITFVFQENVYFCGIKYIEDGLTLTDSDTIASARYQIIEESIQILQEEDVEFISVPVPEFADNDPADIVHDFQRVRNNALNNIVIAGKGV